MKLVIFTFSLWSLFSFLQAQPDQAHQYCHHSMQAGLLREPTLAELMMMENSNKRSDSIDILNYTIRIDVTDFSNKRIQAHTTVDFKTKLDELEWISLDLRSLTIDSILFDGQQIQYQYDNEVIQAMFGEKLALGQVASLDVYYSGVPSRDSVWGGFYFADPYIYNLGIGLSSTPPNFGKVWYPCFDNFVERSSYEYIVTSVSPARAYCVGTFISEDSLSDSKIRRHYMMTDQIPTYLSSIAVSDYEQHKYSHQGRYQEVPIELISRKADLEKMKTQLNNLPGAIDAFEFWFGPYRFERAGFVTTTVGAMEHPTNTAYPVSSINSGTLAQNERLMAHEFGHQWWGNLTTLDDARDMWIKEGNAEYSSHLFFEHVYGKKRFLEVVKDNLAFILFNAHLNDGAFLPLSPMPYSTTYGTHTYRKGAAMIHNLRTYLGDSMYRQICHQVFDSLTGTSMNAFQFRDFLNRHSSTTLDNYFNDHIFNKGYCAFYLDSIFVTETAGPNHADILVQQKDYHADHLFTEAPVFISAYDSKFNRIVQKFWLSGSQNWVKMNIPTGFRPVIFLVNEQQELNLASLQDNGYQIKTGAIPFIATAISPNVTEISDTAFVNIVHHLIGPSEGILLPNIKRLNSRHFWQVNAVAKGNLSMSGRVEFNGNAAGLDENLQIVSEDSIILAYRKDWSEPWRQYSNYLLQKLTPNDKRGFIRIDRLIPGEYAIAYGHPSLVKTNDESMVDYSIYPNPTVTELHIELPDNHLIRHIKMYNTKGQLILDSCVDKAEESKLVDVSRFECGTYELCLADQSGNCSSCQQIQVIH
ncbi:MAG: hypothetical protein IPH93_11740 [Saprospiraceae bacterium]|nr:hypothetical protein [Saprospiraceae bacterium]MBK7812629.1 hypothetical protein [Saprospiraceae bacterium]